MFQPGTNHWTRRELQRSVEDGSVWGSVAPFPTRTFLDQHRSACWSSGGEKPLKLQQIIVYSMFFIYLLFFKDSSVQSVILVLIHEGSV